MRRLAMHRVVAATLSVALATLGLVALATPAQAAGTPNVSFSVQAPDQVLLGDTGEVSLHATNSTGTAGYNASFRLVLPAGATLASASPAASRQVTLPGGARVVLWENVSDLLAGASTSVTAQVSFGNLPPGQQALSAGAYVNSDARYVPDFDDDGTPIVGSTSYTGSGTSSTTTELVPFILTKDVLRPENEVVRGVHDQKTVVSLHVDNNLLGTTSAFEVVDYLPATLEFLQCGDEDNSATGTEEYTGSGRIDDTPAPATTNCPVPSSVETVTTDPPGPQPAGLYTKVTWDSASLADALGSAQLSASSSFTFNYVMAVPEHANEAFGPGAPSNASGDQGSNLDNNTGALTTETGTEQSATNRAVATGTYLGSDYESASAETVALEDLAIQKSVDTSSISQGDVSTWTLDLQVSEYTSTATGVTVTDTVPDGLCPLGAGGPDSECAGGSAPSVAYTTAVENNDGTWTLTWDLPTLASNDTSEITFQTRARTSYQENHADAEPVRANDSWTNDVAVDGTVHELAGTGRAVHDESHADQAAGPISLTKEVAAPNAGACGDGSGLTWEDDTSSTGFGPGDIVCWRLTANAPSGLDTTSLHLTDFLPAGFSFVSSATGTQSDVTIPAADVDERNISWTLTNNGDLDENSTAQVVLESRITSPGAAAPEDLIDNLAKLSYTNTEDDLFQLRDTASAPWSMPVVQLDKSATPTTANSDDTIDYSIQVHNGGDRTALAVQVRDILPDRISCADLTALTAGFLCTADVINGTVASITAGATYTVTYTANLPDDVSPAEKFVNHAGVVQFQAVTNNTPNRFTFVPANNIDPTATPNTFPADDDATVTVQDTAPVKTRSTTLNEAGNSTGQATVGEQVDYSVNVTIPNDTTTTGGSLTDTLPATLALATSSPAVLLDGAAAPAFVVTGSGNTVTVSFPSPYVVPPGPDQVLTLTYSAKVRDVAGVTAGATITNTATLEFTGGDGELVTRSGTSDTRVVEPNLTLSKTEDDVDDRATPGELIDYHVLVGNAAGTSTAHETTVVDTLPTSISPVDGSNAYVADGGVVGAQLGVWDATARTVTWTVSTLAPSASTDLSYRVRVANPAPSPTTFTNTAVATTTSLPGTVAGERTVASTTNRARYTESDSVTLAGPKPSLTKTADVDSAAVGEVVTFTVVATVPADVETFDATVVDSLPTGLRYLNTVSATCTTPVACSDPVATITPSGQQLGWFLGDLAASSQVRNFTIVYRAVVDDVPAATDGANLTNSAVVASNSTDQVTGTPTTPPDPTDFEGATPPASDTVTVIEPTLTLDKEVADETTPDDTRRVVPGETLDYTIAMKNTGTATAHDVIVSDVVDARMVAVEIADGTGWTVTDADPSDGSLSFKIPSIDAGDTVTIAYRLQVPALTSDDEVNGPELTNSADATYRSVASPAAGRDYDDVTPDTVSLEADLSSLGDLVWFDTNGDGVKDAGEPGLADVPVHVVYLGPDGVLGGGDDETHTATTGADGTWLVSDLPAGSFRVFVDDADLPGGTAFSYDLDGADDGTADLTLGEGQDRTDADTGVTGTGSIGDLVWLDRDGDHVVDTGEPGLGGIGVEVQWFGPDGDAGTADDVTYQTLTAADGSWRVDGVPAGDVVVRLDSGTFPAGTRTGSDPDGQLGDDSDGSASSTLTAGDTDLTFDFGLRGDASIGDTLWVDADQDGVLDAGEPGIPGATVQVTWFGQDGVLGGGDDLVYVDTTDGDGKYLVTDVPSGSYEVKVLTLPVSLAPTYDEDDGTTSPDGVTNLTIAFGAAYRTADFGFVAATGVGDLVWLDVNGDGVQDPGEPGLPGVGITVTSAGGDGVLNTGDDITTTTTTGPDGSWLVVGLPSGPTSVSVTSGLPDGVESTFDADGTGTPDVSEVDVVDGATDRTQDFGYRGPNSIGDLVWADVDHDGTADPGEPGLPGVGVEVTFLGADGVLGGGDDVVVTTTTGADGTYRVPGLPNGDYVVRVVSGVPTGYEQTYDETGPADASSTVPGLGADGPQDHSSADFGYGGDGALGGTVWFDGNRNGIESGSAEPGLGGIGIVVTWGGPDGVIGTADDVVLHTTTAPDGSWLVENLPPGPYRASVDPDTLPSDVSVVFDRDDGLTAPDGTWDGTLGASQRLTDVDTGVRGTGSIGDLVWVDTDRDGHRDTGEKLAAGVTVTVTWLGADGVPGGGDDAVFEARTDHSGRYQVDGLPPGAYVVVIDADTLPKGTRAGSDLDHGNATSTRLTLAAGQDRSDADFALYVPPASPTQPGSVGGVSLPRTGAEIVTSSLVGLLLLGLGTLLVRRARRRRVV